MDLLPRLSAAVKGRYEILRELGRGGMSVVFLARDLRLDREVAIKALRPELTVSVGAERFRREIQLVAHFEHIHLLPLYDSGTADDVLYYVMPYARDGSLRDRLQAEGQLGLDDVVRIAREIADGLAHAHARGVVHRDIKPANILFLNGHAVVADFGIAHAYSEAGGEAVTDYGIAIGTPSYMSPEQAAGNPRIDKRSDVYSLGCVVYEMLSGGPPFEGPTTQAILAKHMQELVPSLAVVRPGLPEGMAAAVVQALEKVPGDRLPDTIEFAMRLERGRTTAPRPAASPSRASARRRLTTMPRVVALATVAVAAAAAIPIGRAVLGNPPQPSFERRPRSVLVVPYQTRASTPAERDLATDLADRVTRALNGWEATRAVSRAELSGPMDERGLAGPTMDRVADGMELAQALGVQALVTLTVTIRGDSAHGEATIYDTGTERPVGDALPLNAVAGRAGDLVDPLTLAILDLGELGVSREMLRRRSRQPDALFADAQGTRALERWALDEAERHFRRAVALDSTFAMALHHLAYTLYWHVAQGTRTEADAKPEIARLSTAAVRLTAGGPEGDTLLIQAFRHLQEGDFADLPRARELLRTLLESDPADAEARLMLASVEVDDRWLERKADGSLAPRSNLNEAVRTFTDLVRRQSGFDLGYGHLGTIYREIDRAARGWGCGGFERPREDALVGWDRPTPTTMLAFCPTPLDSLVWIRIQDFTKIPNAIAEARAQRLVSDWTRLLKWWASTAPNVAKSRTELAWVALNERRRPGPTRPEAGDSLARLALRYTSEAVALQSDTLPIDMVWLGALQLGAGNLDRALELTSRGLELMERRGETPPSYAANVFLAAGQPTRALPIAATPRRHVFVPDPNDGHLIAYGGAEPHINRAVMLGATGVGGAPLRAELDAILHAWAGPRYTDGERSALRQHALDALVIPLAIDRSALEMWLDGRQPDAPLWRAMVDGADGSPDAREQLAEASRTRLTGSDGTHEAFMLGQAAGRAGEHSLAVQFYSRLDSVAVRVDALRAAWGIRSLSYLLRAEQYEANAQPDSARAYYQRFIDAWAHADSLTLPLVRRARRQLR